MCFDGDESCAMTESYGGGFHASPDPHMLSMSTKPYTIEKYITTVKDCDRKSSWSRFNIDLELSDPLTADKRLLKEMFNLNETEHLKSIRIRPYISVFNYRHVAYMLILTHYATYVGTKTMKITENTLQTMLGRLIDNRSNGMLSLDNNITLYKGS